MNDKKFQKICGLKNCDHTLLISFREEHLTGKLLDCWEDNFLVEVNGKQMLWPKELCDTAETNYPTPSYS